MGVIYLLIDAGANMEIADNYGHTPFFIACSRGFTEIAGVLLKFGANKDCRTKMGLSPFFQVYFVVWLLWFNRI